MFLWLDGVLVTLTNTYRFDAMFLKIADTLYTSRNIEFHILLKDLVLETKCRYIITLYKIIEH